MPPKIPLPDDADLDAESLEILAKLPPLNVFRMMANAPASFRPLIEFAFSLLVTSEFDARKREIAILRVAHVTRASYEWFQHVIVAKRVGVTDEEIEKIGVDGPVVGTRRRRQPAVSRRGRDQQRGAPRRRRPATDPRPLRHATGHRADSLRQLLQPAEPLSRVDARRARGGVASLARISHRLDPAARLPCEQTFVCSDGAVAVFIVSAAPSCPEGYEE